MVKTNKATKKNSFIPTKNVLKKQLWVLALISSLLYISSLSFDYTLDDTLMITKNSLTQKGTDGLRDIFTSDAFKGFFGEEKSLVAGGRYRPLTHAMFAIEHEYFGDSPFLGHLINIISYSLLILLIFISLRKLFQKYDNDVFLSIAFIASIIFAIHPLHVEIVANVKGRDEIFSLAGAFAALWFSLKYLDTKKDKYLFFSFIVFFLGLLSKENAITFLGIIPLSIFVFRDAKIKDYILTMLPIVLASAVFIFIRSNVLGQIVSTEIPTELLNNPFIESTRIEEIATVLFTWLIYGKLLIFPHPLTHDYYPKQIAIIDFSDPRAIIPLLLFGGIAVFAMVKIWKKNIYAYGILFFILSFSIVSNLFFNIGTFMNERFMFVPLLGFTIILALIFRKLLENKKAQNTIVSLLLILCLAFSVKTISRSFAWKDNYTLFTTDVKTSTNSAKVNVSAAELIIAEAEKETNPALKTQMLEEALVYLERAQEIHPTYFGAWDLTGKVCFLLKKFDYSLRAYQNCLTINPQAPVPLENISLLGQACMQNKDFKTAHLAVDYLTTRHPDNINYQLLEASILFEEGKMDSCIFQYKAIVEKHPQDYRAYSKLGNIYGELLHDIPTSFVYLKQAYSRNNQDLNTVQNLGIVFGMMNEIDSSLKYLHEAEAISPNETNVLKNLGFTYQMNGNQEKANEYFQKANQIQ
jgi:protein O-mannosyl-transferase